MKSVGLIVEYNPLHNGHTYHIEQARLKSNADVAIAVMSGNFLQRGEPAIVDKFTRAKMATLQQVDLVFELPTVYAIQHSDLFAHGAVRMLNELNVDEIIFGSEAGQIKPFSDVLSIIEQNDEQFRNLLKKYLDQGMSYPQANYQALNALSQDLDLDLSKPNNILGFSYFKAQRKINEQLKLSTIRRAQTDYHQVELTQPFASATSIRNRLTGDLAHFSHDELSMPIESYQLLKNYQSKSGKFHNWELYFPLLKYRLMSDSVEQLQKINGMTEGIENRLKSKVRESDTFASFIANVQTKRYSKTRLQRLFTHVLLQLTEKEVQTQIDQIDNIEEFRLLSMTEKGRAYLNHLKNEKKLRIVGQLNRDLSPLLTIDEQATEIYYLPLGDKAQAQLSKQEFMSPYNRQID